MLGYYKKMFKSIIEHAGGLLDVCFERIRGHVRVLLERYYIGIFTYDFHL
jgi:hypothetical protein